MDPSPSRYSEFRRHQTEYVQFTLEDSTDGGATYSAKDVSAGTLTVKLRATTRPPGSAFVLDLTLTKVTAASGIVGGYVTFTAAYGDVEMQLVVIDSATANASTVSGYREVPYRIWRATVLENVAAS